MTGPTREAVEDRQVLQVCAVVKNADGTLAVLQGAEAVRFAYSQLTPALSAPRPVGGTVRMGAVVSSLLDEVQVRLDSPMDDAEIRDALAELCAKERAALTSSGGGGNIAEEDVWQLADLHASIGEDVPEHYRQVHEAIGRIVAALQRPSLSGARVPEGGDTTIHLESLDNPLTITDAQVQRAQRIHNLRCTHTLSSNHVHEMLTAAIDAQYSPDDGARRPVCP